jgi:hypothetical protein
MILSDNETKVDLLNYEAIAATIVELLRERPDQPMTIGVHGDCCLLFASTRMCCPVAL